MDSIGQLFRNLRESKSLPLRKVAAELDIDQAVLSKIERGIRYATRDHVKKIAEMFNIDEKELLVHFYSERFAEELKQEPYGKDILKKVARNMQAYCKDEK